MTSEDLSRGASALQGFLQRNIWALVMTIVALGMFISDVGHDREVLRRLTEKLEELTGEVRTIALRDVVTSDDLHTAENRFERRLTRLDEDLRFQQQRVAALTDRFDVQNRISEIVRLTSRSHIDEEDRAP